MSNPGLPPPAQSLKPVDAASPTSSGPTFTLLAIFSALVLVGMVFGAALWMLAGAAAASIVFINHLLANTWSHTAIATRTTGDSEVKAGARLPVRLTVKNSGRLPILWLLVEDLVPGQSSLMDRAPLKVNGKRLDVMLLWPGQTHELNYEIVCHRRGYFQVGPTVLETGDLMGLYRRYRVGTDPQYITVLPHVTPLSGYDVGSRRPIGEIRMRENVMDDPTRLRGIRRWQPGDPMRSVHWAATARTGTLHSKIYEPSSIAGATLVLDLHASSNPDEHEPVRTDLAIAAAASIATNLHDANEPFALVSNGRDAADRIRLEGWVGDHRVRSAAADAASMLDHSDRMRPVIMEADRGPVHLQEMIRTLARLERTDALTLPQLFAESEGRVSSETTILVVVQKVDNESMSAILAQSQRGRAVAVIINTHHVADYSSIAGPLIASNIPTFHLADDQSITDVCRAFALR